MDTDISILNGNDFKITQLYGENAEWYQSMKIGLMYHSGLDIVSKSGKDWQIENVEKGQVIFAGWKSNGSGNLVRIYCPQSNREWGYLHLESVLCTVGQEIKLGDPIGVIGNTGNSFGRHLHLEVKYRGQNNNNGVWGCVDPLPILNQLDDEYKRTKGQSQLPKHQPIQQAVQPKPQPVQQPLINKNIEEEIDMSAKTDLENLIKSTKEEIKTEVNAKFSELNQRFDGFKARVEHVEAKAEEAKQKAEHSINTAKEVAKQAEQAINQNRGAINDMKMTENLLTETLPETNLAASLATSEEAKKKKGFKDKPNWITTYVPGGAGLVTVMGAMGLDVTDLDKALPFLSRFSARQMMIAGAVVLIIIAIIFYQNKDKIKLN